MSTDFDREASAYRNRLHPWYIIQCLPNAQTEIIARFRRRNDAEAHRRTLKQLNPTALYEIIFDATHPKPNSAEPDR